MVRSPRAYVAAPPNMPLPPPPPPRVCPPDNVPGHPPAAFSGTYSCLIPSFALPDSDDVFDMFVNIFSQMPLAVVIPDQAFVVHGGLSRHDFTIEELAQFERSVRPCRRRVPCTSIRGVGGRAGGYETGGQGCVGRGGGTPPPLHGPQPTPSHCPPDANFQRHL